MKDTYKTRNYKSIDDYTATATLYPWSAETYFGEHVYVEVFDKRGKCVEWYRCANWAHVVERLTSAFGWGWERVRG